MSLATLLVRDVVIQTAGTTVDRYNNTIADWSAPTERSAKAWLAQTENGEVFDHRDATVWSFTATLDITAELQPYERVVIDGQVYEVVGRPNVAHTPRGPHHIEATLRRCAG